MRSVMDSYYTIAEPPPFLFRTIRNQNKRFSRFFEVIQKRQTDSSCSLRNGKQIQYNHTQTSKKRKTDQ